MILKLDLSFHRKARVWLGELPDFTYQIALVEERTLETKVFGTNRVLRAAIEILVPRGGYTQYGLLGGEFSSDRSGQLLVQVAGSDNRQPLADESLAAGCDEVRKGLPFEFVHGTLDGALAAEEIWLLGCGVLRFERAAHGIVGSSTYIFQKLSGAIVRLLAAEAESISAEELDRYLQL